MVSRPESTTNKPRLVLALSLCAAAAVLAASCKSPLFGLGGQVDTEVPGISVTTVDEGGSTRALTNGDYVRGTITLSGKVSDDIGISSVVLSFDEDGQTVSLGATVNAAANTWSSVIDTTAYVDGGKDFVVTVTDTADKTTTTRFVLYIDNKPPTMLLTVVQPTEGSNDGTAGSPLYGTIAIKGSVADQFGIRKVRVYLYSEAGALLYSSPDNASIGTNSFSVEVDTSALLGVTGSAIGRLFIVAYDRSGNTNTHFYRSDDINGLNGNQGATVEDLNDLEMGTETEVNDLTLDGTTDGIAQVRRYQPGTGYADDQLASYYFNQNANLPIITISNPEAGKTADQNLISRSAKAMGLVEDANGVQLVEVQFDSDASAWYSDAHPGVDGDDIDVSGTGKVVNWYTKKLNGNYGGLDVGVHQVRVRATDTDGNVRLSDWVAFTIDADAPSVDITSPEPGDYVSGNSITISGTAQSYGTATVATVEVTVAGTFGYTAATLSGADPQDVSWSFDLTNLHVPVDGTYTVKARVTDSGSKEALYNIVVTIDRTPPSVPVFKSPSSGSSINGYPTLTGTANDNIMLDKVYLVFEKAGESTELADTYNWSYDLDAGSFANTTYGYDMGNNIYRVPFRLRAVDLAGNEAFSPSFGADPDAPAAGSYYLDVDLDGDKPEVNNIISPGSSNAITDPYEITGSIKVQGTATDDDGLHSVEMALIAYYGTDGNGDGVGDSESWRNLADPTGASVAAGTYYAVNGKSLWYWLLNDAGDLYALSSLSGHEGYYRLSVRAVDTKDGVTADVTGDAVDVYIHFDNTLPGVISLSPEESTVHSGTFAMGFTAEDNTGISLAQVSYNNGLTYTDLALGPTPTSMDFTVSVNSKTVNSNAFATSSGTLYMRIRLKDASNNITEKSFKYLIDNLVPVDVTPPDSSSMLDINDGMYTEGGASLAEILGVVNDTGTVRGIDRVEVYLERGDADSDGNGDIHRANPDDPAGSIEGAEYAFSNGNYLYTTDADYKIVIDNSENYVDSDADGYPESLTQGASGYTWGACFDSSLIADGDVTVHYVIWDEAGNSRHLSMAGAIRNNPPEWLTVVLGTNLNGDTSPADATDDGERIKLTLQPDGTWQGYTLKADGSQLGATKTYDLATDTILTVRNSLLTFSATTSCTNGTIEYNAYHPDGSTSAYSGWSAASAFSETAFTAGSGWTEDSTVAFSAIARDDAFGTPFTTATLSLRVALDNVDGEPPEAFIEQLAYDDYLVSGTEAQGHIEPWDQSPYDNNDAGFDKTNAVYGNDADVSGTIIISGAASDNQRIQYLYMWIDADGSGAVNGSEEQVVATFDGAVLAPTANTLGAITIASQTLDQDGHEAAFTFEWDSSDVSGVARSDVAIRVRAEDFKATPNSSVQAPASLTDTTALGTAFNTIKVDVVPYITGISTNVSGIKDDNVRATSGSYSIKAGSTANYMAIAGFNLNVTSARITKAAATADAGGETLTISTSASSSDGWQSLSLTNDSARSGYLTLFTSSGIPTLNNLNSESLSTDMEPDTTRKNLTLLDDRYVEFFTATSTAYSGATYPAMVMNGGTPIFGYAHNGAASGTGYYETLKRQGSRVARGWQFSQNALAIDTAGHYYQLSISDNSGSSAGGLHLFYDVYSTTANDMSVQWTYPEYSGYASIRSYNTGNNALALDHLKYDGDTAGSDSFLKLNRFKRPRIVVKGSAASTARIYMAYYDDMTEQLAFRDLQIGATVTGSVGSLATASIYYNQAEGNFNSSATATNRHNVTSAASPYLDIGVTDDNRVVLVYYDQATSRLKLIYSTTAIDGSSPSTVPVWSSPQEIDSKYAGAYVSMYIESDNNAGTPDPIHLAYYDSSNSDLHYSYLASYSSSATSVKVDAYNSVGILTSIKVVNGVPYIAYYNNSENGTMDSIKIAKYAGTYAPLTAGVNATGYVTGDWIIQTVPVNTVPLGGLPEFSYVMLDFLANGCPVVGFLGDTIEWSTPLPELAD